MKKTTQWKPDTCKCVIEYEWDDSLSEESRVHSVSRILRACQFHQATANNKDLHFNSVISENRKKNYSVAAIVRASGDRIEPQNVEWSFDSNRRLKLKAKSLSDTEKTIARAELVKIANDIDLE